MKNIYNFYIKKFIAFFYVYVCVRYILIIVHFKKDKNRIQESSNKD